MRKTPGSRLLAAFALALLAPLGAAQTTWYVDDDAPPGGDGASWAGALRTLERAFAFALPGDSIWVAKGTYRPILRSDPSDPRSATFLVPQAVRLFGGFDGTEPTLDQRAGLFRDTVLSGDLGVVGDDSDNAYTVVSVIHPGGIPPGATRIDGFQIRGARDGLQGGGVHSFNSSTVLRNCLVTDNRAFQGAAFHAQPGALRILDCTVTDNEALDKGGALWGHALNVYALHSTFARNRCDGKGGAIYLHSGSSADYVRFVGCLFHDNQADVGGAIFVGGGQFSAGAGILHNCVVALNRATTRGGGIVAVTETPISADLRVYDTIVWRNQAPADPQIGGEPTVRHCAVQGGAPGAGNIAADPRFVDLGARNFRLAAGSPCIDAGDNAWVPPDKYDLDDDGDTLEPLPRDLAGRPRFADDPAVPDTGSGAAPIVDMGPYERQP